MPCIVAFDKNVRKYAPPTFITSYSINVFKYAFEYLRDQPEMSFLEKYQAITSRAELANLLEISHPALTYLLYVKPNNQKYSTFRIPKKSGGIREIFAPTPELKSLQRRVADQLSSCLLDIEKATGQRNKASHGFMPNKSILTNASVHRNKRYVFNMDLKDFFPTISGQRIRGLLINDRRLQFHTTAATTLAHIACHNGVLPQGSPCSPVISNLIAGILDVHLSRLAKDYGCRYTRYADDITFSTNLKQFPSAIATTDPANSNKWIIGSRLEKAIKNAGFSVNQKKTRMQYKTSRQTVTGLVVNNRINVPAEYRHRTRAYVHFLITRGKFHIRERTKDENGNVIDVSVPGTPAQLHGMLGFIHSVDNVLRANQKKYPYNYPNKQGLTEKDTGNLAIYRRFLLYTHFYANDAPFVVCEGKTDNVYISSAIHQLQHQFPMLVTVDPVKKRSVLSFRFMRYARQHRKKQHIYMPNFSTASILGAGSGGGPNLAALIRSYHKDISRFKAPLGSHPVLFIVDNDDGGKPVFKTIKDLLKIEIDRSQPFTRIFSNVYIIPISREGHNESSIEDLFAPADIARGLNGKPFNFSKNSDPKTTCGKEQFAYHFVSKNANQLDWTGFKPLLQNMCAALTDYSNLN